MDLKTAAVVLCAGTGSRAGLPPGVNKCAVSAGGIIPVRYQVEGMMDAGIEKITVVTGYASETVQQALGDYEKAGIVEFVENSRFDWHGCNYSLACGMAGRYASAAERVLVAEGDSLLNRDSVCQIVDTASPAASLVRPASYIDFRRSVVAVGNSVGNSEKILRYEYDKTHTGHSIACGNEMHIIGDSMQVWSFSDGPLERLKGLLVEYRREADEGDRPMTHSGIYSINMLETGIEPVFSEHPDDWINLNTQEDLRKAGNAKWLVR